ncbi:thioredoxin domain-containing protein 8 isoform X3 [Herpailurus yagouaroundi]|uniref:thioredoxin domain-containing protein 8 isoform X3 n=1 Tax=Herpailurus yagouaroundi TaxID=1608482 RepID=UPI001AD6C7AE|nr:thioredoxin domain-containing protein 8 isoform X3 [Puma yagouaroundi]
MVQIIKDMDEFSRFLKAAGCKLVVVEFSAKWCGPCKRIYPLVHELAQTYHIRSVPTFQMFKQTQKGSISMARPVSELRPHQEWALDSSQANLNPTRANPRMRLKQLGKSLLFRFHWICLNLGRYEAEGTTASCMKLKVLQREPENEATIQ